MSTHNSFKTVHSALQSIHTFITMSCVRVRVFCTQENWQRDQMSFYVYPLLSLFVRLCQACFLSFCSHNSTPTALITTSTKYPVENTSSLIRDCSILSIHRHYFLSGRLTKVPNKREITEYFIDSLTLSFQPWICLNLKVEPPVCYYCQRLH